MLLAIVIGGSSGALVGVIGAYVAAFLQLRARHWRNDRLVARGEMPWKDAVFLPLWRVSGALGFLGGGAIAAFAHPLWMSAAAGIVVPLLLALTSVWILVQARRVG